MTNVTTLEQVESIAAGHGLILTPSDRAKVAATQKAELARLMELEANEAEKRSWVDTFNQFYPRFLEALYAVSDVLLTLAQTIIVAFGIPATLVLLLVVEHQRVMHGIQLFEIDMNLASFFGLALVVLNLVLEFQIHYVEQRAKYEAARDTRWSFKLWRQNMAYRLGISKQWQPQLLSPAARYRRLLRLVTFTILALALAGSMKAAIQSQDGAWYQALAAIVTQSKLIEMATWSGGLLAALAAVLAAQGLSRYVALKCAEIAVGMGKHQQLDPVARYQVEIEAAGARAAMALIQEKVTKRDAKRAPAMEAKADVPFVIEEDTKPMQVES